MFHGDHGMSDKWYAFEESIKVPLIIRDPRMSDQYRGTRNTEFTLSIDIAPTLLASAQIPIPSVMQGRDIADLYLPYHSQWQPNSLISSMENMTSSSSTTTDTTETTSSRATSRRRQLSEVDTSSNTTTTTATTHDPVVPLPWRQDFFYEWNQGRKEDGMGHPPVHHIPAVFALIEKQFKYIYWPHFKYEQLYNNIRDVYEEYDIYNATLQSNEDDLKLLKARYQYMKHQAQNGFRV
jgi:hypothetical protein